MVVKICHQGQSSLSILYAETKHHCQGMELMFKLSKVPYDIIRVHQMSLFTDLFHSSQSSTNTNWVSNLTNQCNESY